MRDMHTICHSLQPHTHSWLFLSGTSPTHCPLSWGQLLWQQGCVCACVCAQITQIDYGLVFHLSPVCLTGSEVL